MAGLNKRERAKLSKLRRKAADGDDSLDILRLSDFASDMNAKYGEGTVDDPSNVYNKGGKATKKVPVISIGVGMAEMKKGKAKMMRGGMANKKEHMYVAGGSVTDKMNPGLRALNKTRPDVVKKILS